MYITDLTQLSEKCFSMFLLDEAEKNIVICRGRADNINC